MLEEAIKELATHLANKHNLNKIPYEIIIKPELPVDHKGRDRIILIKAGNPPIICISHTYIVGCFTNSKKLESMHGLKDTILWSLQMLPKMYHTLALVPMAEAISLRINAKKWSKSLVPLVRTELPKKHLKVKSVTIELEDVITNTTIIRTGSDYNEVLHRCERDLARLVISNEEMNDWREKLVLLEETKEKPIPPNEISMSFGKDEFGSNITETEISY